MANGSIKWTSVADNVELVKSRACPSCSNAPPSLVPLASTCSSHGLHFWLFQKLCHAVTQDSDGDELELETLESIEMCRKGRGRGGGGKVPKSV